MNKTWTVAVLTTALFAGNSQADFVGLNIGSSFWSPDLTGSFNSSSSANDISVGSDLDISDHSQQSIVLSFEHPIPGVPNVKFQNYDLNTNSSSNVTNLDFKGQTFNGQISSTLDVSHNDLVLYYELLDNWVNLDLGLNIKTFAGEVSMSEDGGGNNESINIDEVIPLIYVSARFDLPFSGFYVGANIQNISLVDNTAEDSTLMVGYESSSGLGIEGGYKTFSLNLDDASNLNTSIEYDGLYLNGYFHF